MENSGTLKEKEKNKIVHIMHETKKRVIDRKYKKCYKCET